MCVCLCVFVCMCVCVFHDFDTKCHTNCARVLTGAILGTCIAETIFMKAFEFHELVYIRILPCNMYIMKPSETGLLSFHTTCREN